MLRDSGRDAEYLLMRPILSLLPLGTLLVNGREICSVCDVNACVLRAHRNFLLPFSPSINNAQSTISWIASSQFNKVCGNVTPVWNVITGCTCEARSAIGVIARCALLL